jgi:hypothetical protein
LLNGFKSDKEARRALAEIERLLRDAEAAGLALDPWLTELAEEMDRAGAARLAARITADPRLSLAAQQRLRADTVRALGVGR